KASSIVAKVGYDPTSTDVQPQIAQLKASKANVLCIFAFGKFSLQAYNGLNRVNWHPQVFVNDVSSASALMIAVPQTAANGSISASWSGQRRPSASPSRRSSCSAGTTGPGTRSGSSSRSVPDSACRSLLSHRLRRRQTSGFQRREAGRATDPASAARLGERKL